MFQRVEFVLLAVCPYLSFLLETLLLQSVILCVFQPFDYQCVVFKLASFSNIGSFGQQTSPYCTPKEPLLHVKRGSFATPNGLYCVVKRYCKKLLLSGKVSFVGNDPYKDKPKTGDRRPLCPGPVAVQSLKMNTFVSCAAIFPRHRVLFRATSRCSQAS